MDSGEGLRGGTRGRDSEEGLGEGLAKEIRGETLGKDSREGLVGGTRGRDSRDGLGEGFAGETRGGDSG